MTFKVSIVSVIIMCFLCIFSTSINGDINLRDVKNQQDAEKVLAELKNALSGGGGGDNAGGLQALGDLFRGLGNPQAGTGGSIRKTKSGVSSVKFAGNKPPPDLPFSDNDNDIDESHKIKKNKKDEASKQKTKSETKTNVSKDEDREKEKKKKDEKEMKNSNIPQIGDDDLNAAHKSLGDCEFECGKGFVRRRNPDADPEIDGCKDRVGLGIIKIDPTLFGFDPCCRKKNECYNECGRKLGYCKKRFGDCLREQCTHVLNDVRVIKACNEAATLYEAGDGLFECLGFRTVQSNACECVEDPNNVKADTSSGDSDQELEDERQRRIDAGEDISDIPIVRKAKKGEIPNDFDNDRENPGPKDETDNTTDNTATKKNSESNDSTEAGKKASNKQKTNINYEKKKKKKSKQEFKFDTTNIGDEL